MNWQIQNGTQVLSCDEVGADTVILQALPRAGGLALVNSFACVDGGGSFAVAEGVYDVRVELIAGVNTVLGQPYEREGIRVDLYQDVPLGIVAFDVVPTGSLVFVMNAGAVASNCDAVADGGAGITSVVMELIASDGNCVPTTFQIGAGEGRAADFYQSDCAGASFACVERDQEIRVDDVSAGTLRLELGANVGAFACYQRSTIFDLAGDNQVTTLAPQILLSTGASSDECPRPNPVDAGVPEVDAGIVDAGLDAGSLAAGGAAVTK